MQRANISAQIESYKDPEARMLLSIILSEHNLNTPYHRQRDQISQVGVVHSGTEYQCNLSEDDCEVHKDDIVLPGDSHVTAMESIKDDFGLKTSATTTPVLLKVTLAAIASQHVRVQRRLLGLGTAPAQQKPRKR